MAATATNVNRGGFMGVAKKGGATEEGDPFDPNKTVEELLGMKATREAKLTDQEKNFTWRDIARSNQARFDPPAGQTANVISGPQWDHIILAIEKKTGFKYKGGGANSCCCTL
jgi:hypothetical protein